MEITVRAVYTNGVFAPAKRYKLKLKEGEGVELLIKKLSKTERDPAYDLSDLAVEAGIPDLASEHDHYLYGTPKRGKRNGRKTRVR
jgi:predicted DNA-binding antitoxin AbrB/MazE fold protein